MNVEAIIFPDVGPQTEAMNCGPNEPQLFRFLSDYVVRVKVGGIWRTITAREGFVTDWATVPAFGKVIVDDDDSRILRASVAHDVLYTTAKFDDGALCDRELADEILRYGMLACGSNSIIAWLVYRAVRIFGAKHYSLPLAT